MSILALDNISKMYWGLRGRYYSTYRGKSWWETNTQYEEVTSFIFKLNYSGLEPSFDFYFKPLTTARISRLEAVNFVDVYIFPWRIFKGY